MRDRDWQIALLAPSTLRTMATYLFDGSYERVLRRSGDIIPLAETLWRRVEKTT